MWFARMTVGVPHGKSVGGDEDQLAAGGLVRMIFEVFPGCVINKLLNAAIYTESATSPALPIKTAVVCCMQHKNSASGKSC